MAQRKANVTSGRDANLKMSSLVKRSAVTLALDRSAFSPAWFRSSVSINNRLGLGKMLFMVLREYGS